MPSLETSAGRRARDSVRRFAKCEWALVILFLMSLPFSNPWVRGDGVGYYAFARSLLIEHRLDFTKDWQRGNTSFRMDRLAADGQPLPDQYTITGHLDNHFSVGPAILWSPFLIAAHVGVLLCDLLGGHISADGFSKPYLLAMALGTAVYGFLALVISFALARRYVAERWAFLATLGIWFGSALPVYMYFNPSWSHAHSAFMVALFVWYWTITRPARTWSQWALLGGIGGLMLDVYYLSGALLLLPLLESLAGYWNERKAAGIQRVRDLFIGDVLFGLGLFVAVLPSLFAKKIIFGAYLKSGYEHLWVWSSPALLKVGLSADHGLFSWHPILIAAAVGLFYLRRYDKSLSVYSLGVFAALLYIVGCYTDWDGISSFGNRFFVLMTPLFVLGLASCFDWLARALQDRRAAVLAWSGTTVLALWNLGLIFQWGMHLIPERGPIRWSVAAYNQVAVVPVEVTRSLRDYLTHRQEMMDRIEQKDVNQIKSQQSDGTERTP